ncbi:M48 family metallopeptidase [Candidatus Nitrospira salsa]
MKYQPSLPERNDNVSHQHPIREFGILILSIIGVAVISFWILGFFIDQAVGYISPEDEVQLFAKIDLDWEFGETASGPRQALVQHLIEALRPCQEIGFSTPVTIIESQNINAMAIPGGKIVVFSELLKSMKTENGLAFVLAHELGHFKNRDHLRSIGRGLVLAALSTLLTGANSSISQMLTSSMTLGQAKYSQSRESQADETALQILNCHYGHVGGATELFEALQRQEGTWDINILHYFDTHPELQKRIEAIHELSKQQGYTVEEPLPLKKPLPL